MRADPVLQHCDCFGSVLEGIYVPEAVAQKITDSLQADSERAESERQACIAGIQRGSRR